MKKLIYSKAFWYVVINVVIVGCVVGSILYTLTYTGVPIQYQHEWFGTDLHKFLIFEHSMTLGLGILFALVFNIWLTVEGENK